MNIKKVILSLVVVPCLMAILSFSSNAAIQVYPHISISDKPYLINDMKSIIRYWNSISGVENVFEFNPTVKYGYSAGVVDSHCTVYFVSFSKNTNLPLVVRNYPKNLAYALNGDIYINGDFPYTAGTSIPDSNTIISFYGLFQHELGHVLGLKHNDASDSTMNINQKLGWFSITLSKTDINNLSANMNWCRTTNTAYFLNPFNGPGRTSWN